MYLLINFMSIGLYSLGGWLLFLCTKQMCWAIRKSLSRSGLSAINQIRSKRDNKAAGNAMFSAMDFFWIITTIGRIGSSQNRNTGIQSGHNTSLGNRNSLLFHNFVDSSTILISHLVKLVNAANSLIGQD